MDNSKLLDERDKFRELFMILAKWITINQQGRYIGEYFKRANYKNVAIYGMGEVGLLLYNELNNAGINVVCGIDKNADYMTLDIECDLFEPHDELPEIDVIVVTAIHYYDEIKSDLSNNVGCPIISLMNVIDWS
jgi:ketol-acid reductoisomerase